MVQKVGSSHSKSEYILQKCMIYSQAKKSVAFERFVGLFPYLCTYIWEYSLIVVIQLLNVLSTDLSTDRDR